MLEIRNQKLYIQGHLIGDEETIINHLDNSTKWKKTRDYFLENKDGDTQ